MACIARGIIQIYFTLVEVWTRISIFFFSSGVKVLQNYDPKKKIALSARTVRSAKPNFAKS